MAKWDILKFNLKSFVQWGVNHWYPMDMVELLVKSVVYKGTIKEIINVSLNTMDVGVRITL